MREVQKCSDTEENIGLNTYTLCNRKGKQSQKKRNILMKQNFVDVDL
jgi:hypothetical protein